MRKGKLAINVFMGATSLQVYAGSLQELKDKLKRIGGATHVCFRQDFLHNSYTPRPLDEIPEYYLSEDEEIQLLAVAED